MTARSPPSCRSATRSSLGQFTQVASAGAPTTAIPRSNIFAFDATTGAIDTVFAPVLDAQVESLAAAPDGPHVFAGVPTGPTTVVSTGFGTPRGLLVLNLPT